MCYYFLKVCPLTRYPQNLDGCMHAVDVGEYLMSLPGPIVQPLPWEVDLPWSLITTDPLTSDHSQGQGLSVICRSLNYPTGTACLLFWHHLRKGLFLSPELSENTKRICCLKKTDCKRERLLESYPRPLSNPHQLQELVLEFGCWESLFSIGFPPKKKQKPHEIAYLRFFLFWDI